MEKLIDRFLRYVSVETTSNPDSNSQPSSQCQFNLLKMLTSELQAMGIEATLDEYGYVMATIPSNIKGKVPAIGFIAHVDTAPDASGRNIKPQIIENYNGEDVILNKKLGIKIPVKDFPEILQYKGQTIITTDGTTLLGADDKAGVAEIMCAAEYIMEHPDFKHGEIKIGFTPDEEIGRGVDKFDVARFGADYGYTIDGGQLGELEYENFTDPGAQCTPRLCQRQND
jgi:tripeptide aminopeptidase